MTRDASTVVVGGGIWGLSTAYHLARAGQADVRVLERNEEPIGETTPQAAGLVGQIRATPVMQRAIRYAIDLFAGFERESGHDPGFRQVGSLLLALTPERLESFQKHVEGATRSGVAARFVDAAEMSGLRRTWTWRALRADTSCPRTATSTPGNARGLTTTPPGTSA